MHILLALFLIVVGFLLIRFTILWISFLKKSWKYYDLTKPSYLFPIISAVVGGGDAIVKITEELLTKDPNADFYYFGANLQGQPIIVVNNLDAMKEVFSNEQKFPKYIRPLASKLLGRGLVTSTGDLWKRERRILTPGFHFGTLRELVPTMVEQSRLFINKMKDVKESWIPAKQVFVSVTLRVIIATAFGGQFDADWMEKRWTNVLQGITPYAVYRALFGSLAEYLPMTYPIRKANQEIVEQVKKFIAKRRIIPADNQSRADIVGLMLHNGEEDDQLILDEVKTFLIAGHETTSNLLAWSCYFLGKHPDVQEKAYQEVIEVLGDREPTGDDISKLKYIKAILEECLRLRPVVTLLAPRVNPEEVTLAGRTFPAGTFFSVYILGAHWNEKNWEKADQFIPERFLESGKDMKKHPFAFIPFSAGPRNCIGQKFSLQEGAIILSMILQNFTITIDDRTLRPIAKPTLVPEGLSLKFISRVK